MYKKKLLAIIICVFFLVGCNTTNINNLSLTQIVDVSLEEENKAYNTNNKGYRYYLPTEFEIIKDDDYVQILNSHGNTYYLNINIVSYYYKNKITTEHKLDDYEYYTFESNDKTGYLRITQNNEDFFVELCYNYAIIEVEVEEDDLKYAVSRGMAILNSIKYNDLIISKNINNNSLETSETLYSIPEPKNKDESKNVLEYIDEYDENKGQED